MQSNDGYVTKTRLPIDHKCQVLLHGDNVNSTNLEHS